MIWFAQKHHRREDAASFLFYTAVTLVFSSECTDLDKHTPAPFPALLPAGVIATTSSLSNQVHWHAPRDLPGTFHSCKTKPQSIRRARRTWAFLNAFWGLQRSKRSTSAPFELISVAGWPPSRARAAPFLCYATVSSSFYLHAISGLIIPFPYETVRLVYLPFWYWVLCLE